jgi:MATE family multidrug resistance protein
MTIAGIAITCGMNSALSTLISQSFGANNMHLCGVYYNQACIIVTMLFIPIMIVLGTADNIFRAIGFEEHVCQYALTFILYKSPNLYFFSLYDATKKLLYNTGYQNVPMYIQIATTIVHPLWCYLFVHVWKLGVRGPAIAISLTQTITFFILFIYLSRKQEFKEIWFFPMPNASAVSATTSKSGSLPCASSGLNGARLSSLHL